MDFAQHVRGILMSSKGNAGAMENRKRSDKESVKELGAEYIEYVNGEPNFTRFSICTVTIPSMTIDRYHYSNYYKSNFEQAYPEIAKKVGIDVTKVKKWLKDNHYTMHESSDVETIYVIPTEIHKTYIHAEGVAECNAIQRDDEESEIIDIVERSTL